MARCGCSQSCNCVVTAGENTTVTGNGTPQNPYVVNSTAFCYEFVDSESVDFTTTPPAEEGACSQVTATARPTVVQGDGTTTTVTGTGTPSDPYVVSATPDGPECCPTVVAGPSGGTTVTPSTGPDGQTIYTVDSAPGGGSQTYVADGDNTTLTGTGTAADPYRVHACAPTAGCGIVVTTGPDGCPIISLDPGADGEAVFAVIPAVQNGAESGSPPAPVVGGGEVCLNYTNNTCKPMYVEVSLRSGQRVTSVHAPASQLQVSARGSFSFPGLAGAISTGATAAALSNRITPAPGSTAVQGAMGVTHPPMVAFVYGEVIQPGQSVSVCGEQTVELQNGMSQGRALAGLLLLNATPSI